MRMRVIGEPYWIAIWRGSTWYRFTITKLKNLHILQYRENTKFPYNIQIFWDVGWMMCQFYSKIVRPVSAVRPSSVTDNLGWRYHFVSGYDMVRYHVLLPCVTTGHSPRWYTVNDKKKIFYIILYFFTYFSVLYRELLYRSIVKCY